jgi:hypothetical protein
MSEPKSIKGKLIQHATELFKICPDPFPALFLAPLVYMYFN